MINMYLQIFLRLNLIVLFLLLIRKMIGKRLRKKFVYGLWIVVPAFLLSFPFVRLPRLFHWEMNMGNLFQLEGKNVEPQEVVTSITDKKLVDPIQETNLNSDERLTPNEFLNKYEVPDQNEIPDQNEVPNQNDNLNWKEAWHQSTDSEWNEISYQNEVAIGNKALIEKGNQDENPLQNGISEEKAETVKTQVQPATNMTTPAKGMKLSTVVGAVYLLMVATLLLYIVISNVLFRISCRKKRIYLRKSEGVGLAVYHLEGITSPFLMGKTIYLPSYMVEEEQIRYAILHEESHYLHGDAFWVIVRYIVLAIYFYDPVIWLAFFASGRDCELACDEAVLGKISEEEGSAYGACLLKSVEQKLHKNRRMVMTTNMSTDKKFMKERIVNIMNRKKKSRITMALAVAIMMVVTGCAYEKQNVDTSKQESLTSEIEETTEGNEPELAEETEGKSESQEESVETLIEVSNIDEDVRVTENDEVADNTEESNNVSEDDFTLPDFDSNLIEDYTDDFELISVFKDNEKPDTENFRDFKEDLDKDGEIDTITLKNRQYGSHDFSLYLNGEEFYQFPNGGVGVYIVDLFDNDPSRQVAACYEDPSGDGLNYSIFRKQGEKMIYSGELKSKYFTQPDTDLYTIEEDALEYETESNLWGGGRGWDLKLDREKFKDFKYDLDGDGEIDTITFEIGEEDIPVLSLNGKMFCDFIYNGAAVYIIELNKEDGTLGVVAYDDGPSADPNYTIFRKQGEEMECIMWTSEYSGCMFDKMGRIYTECAPVLDPPLCNVCYDLRQDTVKKYRSNLKEVENVWYTSDGVFVNELDYMPDFLDIPENVEFKVLEKGYYPFGRFLGYKVQLRDGKVCYIPNGLCWGD